MRIAVIFGTRPEAIKMAPVVRELRTNSKANAAFQTLVFVTAQHREMLDQVLRLFEIEPDVDLDIMRPGQDLAGLTARLIEGLDRLLSETSPELVLVHGDTTTALAASLAAYYRKIPVGHVEAGLRTRNPYSPFPEEMNRHLVDTLALHHFAPTVWAAENLKHEGIDVERIVVTGNTAIDALRLMLEKTHQRGADDFRHRQPELARILELHTPIVLVTSHRRESFGISLEGICEALIDLTKRFENLAIIYPVHLNPDVRATVTTVLSGHERIYLTNPLDYDVFCHLMATSRLILTDSGGIQEEAPSLDRPVLVLRDTSERPEAVESGAARVVGTQREAITAAAVELLTDPEIYAKMAGATNPYGDGYAAQRIVTHLMTHDPIITPASKTRSGDASG
jgi:UDP-N-acetylglucosamine 2-epimerase (non-hydrolysing)